MSKVLGGTETRSDGHGWVRCTDDGKMYGDEPGCTQMIADIITTDKRGNVTCVECQTSDGVWH